MEWPLSEWTLRPIISTRHCDSYEPWAPGPYSLQPSRPPPIMCVCVCVRTVCLWAHLCVGGLGHGKRHHCSSTILICPHHRAGGQSGHSLARYLLTDQSPCSRQKTLCQLSEAAWALSQPPLCTNKITVKMKRIITADIFIPCLPYLITNLSRGGGEDSLRSWSFGQTSFSCWEAIV